jgi:hypothetical protein
MSMLWRRALITHPNLRSVHADGDVVLVTELDTRLCRLEPATGEPQWEVKITEQWSAYGPGRFSDSRRDFTRRLTASQPKRGSRTSVRSAAHR